MIVYENMSNTLILAEIMFNNGIIIIAKSFFFTDFHDIIFTDDLLLLLCFITRHVYGRI